MKRWMAGNAEPQAWIWRREEEEISKGLDGVSRRFRAWREQMGLTLDEVQQAVNRELPSGEQVGRSTVNNYEGRNPPSVPFVIALKRAYPRDLDLDWLLFGEESPDADEDAEEAVIARVTGIGSEESFETFRQAAGPIDEFLADLLLQYREYQAGNGMLQSLREPSEPMRELHEIVGRVFSVPFEKPNHFVTLDELTAPEVVNYGYTVISALRPLLRVVQEDRRRARHPQT